MTLDQAIAELTAVTALDQSAYKYSGGSLSNDDATRLLNFASDIVARRAKIFEPSVTLVLTAGTQTYNLSDPAVVTTCRVLRPTRVTINQRPLRAYDGTYGLWTLHELERRVGAWRTTSTATPTVAAWLGQGLLSNSAVTSTVPGGGRLVLWKAPSAAVVSSGNNFVSGFVAPHWLVYGAPQSSKQLPLPFDLHRAQVLVAASLGERPTATEREAWARAQDFDREAFEVVDEMARLNRNAAAQWGTGSGAMYPDEVWG